MVAPCLVTTHTRGMNKISISFGAALTILGFLAINSVAFAQGDGQQRDQDQQQRDEKFRTALAHIVRERHASVCARGGEDTAYCHAHVAVDANGVAKAAVVPAGLGPKDFHAAYGAQATVGSQRIIGIVDAYDDPNIASDLATYSATYGIPSLPNCVGAVAASAVPCFKKVDQRGGTRYPFSNSGWALEIALDVEAAHAMCQNCSIVLVEADSSSFTNLLTAEDRAATLGATVISNSWGANEFSSETSSTYDGHFNKPGIAITVSSGDSGYGAEYPAASRYVTAVGGTTLVFNPDGTYAGEAAWSGTGSGCSSYESKPVWQGDTGCAKRSIADVSAVADPSTGAAVYDSVRYAGQRGWFKVGGTSLASPLIAASYALSGNTAGAANQIPYALGTASNLHDVTTGSNGSCGVNYLCNALLGYDGPTGLGTPNGFSAF